MLLPPFSIIFLWSHNLRIGPNIQNLAKSLKLTCSNTVKFGTEGKKLKNSENSVISLFFLIWQVSIHKTTSNYVLTKFRGISLAISMIFVHISPLQLQKFRCKEKMKNSFFCFFELRYLQRRLFLQWESKFYHTKQFSVV